jgi:neurotransmitter:Na+ symporter, NSS family
LYEIKTQKGWRLNSKSNFSQRFTFYLLAIGSACGLGNIWRFPYIVGENGGGAFLLLYVFLCFTVGLSLLTAELIIGRAARASLHKITVRLTGQTQRPFYWVGRLSLIISFVILAYYSVISGWVLYYLTQFGVSFFRTDTNSYLSSLNMTYLTDNGILQFMLASVHLLICAFILLYGKTRKFEKILSYFLMLFALLISMLIYTSVSLDANTNVLRFLFYPDFTKLNFTSLGHALGHVFFTLSLGMGVLVTLGSYFKDEEHIPTIAFRVTMIDTAISIIAVLIIFPVAFSLSERPMTDPSLLFESLPRLFMKIYYGEYFGFVFFICLWMAAINASVGLLETLIANTSERFRQSNRAWAAWIVVMGTLLLTVLPAFSGTYLKKIKIFDQSVIENIDSLLINYLLPIAVLGFIFVYFRFHKSSDRQGSFVSVDSPASMSLYKNWIWILKWVTPAIIIVALFLQILAIKS